MPSRSKTPHADVTLLALQQLLGTKMILAEIQGSLYGAFF